MSCVICTESYNTRCRKCVTCMYCNFEACRTCCEQYLLSKSVPTCMGPNCQREWTQKFLLSHLSQKFMKGPFRLQSEKICLDTEIALMPSTQPVVEEILKLERESRRMRILQNAGYRKIDRRIQNLIMNRAQLDSIEGTVKFIKGCPATGCRGFLSTQWNCGICQTKVCCKCLAIKTDEATHECTADDLATAEFLRTDTKQCPKCPTRIHKIDGCDQMWCVQCQTAFSWRTGELVRGNIHNPHYFRWMQNREPVMERNPNDILCGREMSHLFALAVVQQLQQRLLAKEVKNAVGAMLANFLYFSEIVTNFPAFDAMDNRKERIGYMCNEITEADFKKTIYLSQKHNDHNREIRMWLLCFKGAGTELIYNFEDKLRNQTEIPVEAQVEEFKTEIGALEAMVNSELAEFCKLAGIKKRQFHLQGRNEVWNLKKC